MQNGVRRIRRYGPLLLALTTVAAVAYGAQKARRPLPFRARRAAVPSSSDETRPPAAASGAAQGPSAAAMATARDEVVALAPDGFTVLTELPFVVAGDGPPEQVEQRARTTVRWTVRMLRQDFFDKLPAQPLQIWLFANRASYDDHTLALFARKPTTPYGFYLADKRALIMNIATGGGTLVHEIVHPFMEANYPQCPPWLNEGLGSLFEQSDEVDGHIVGLTNWRLAGLQHAIRESRTVSLSWLLAMDDHEFYGTGSGLHYAQARYLLYFLQDRGLLRPFFRQALADRGSDPSGAKTLEKTLEIDDLAAFQKRWEAYVMRLRFPER